MENDAKRTDWQEIEYSLITQWYSVSKIMSTIIPKTFPYLTFMGLVQGINNDPNFKNADEDKK